MCNSQNKLWHRMDLISISFLAIPKIACCIVSDQGARETLMTKTYND